MTRILIADDHAIVREGLKKVLEGRGYELDEARNCCELLKKIGRQKYNLVILDISMPDSNGLEVLGKMKSEQPGLPVLILTIYPEEQYALFMIKAGASGYLTKGSVPEELVKAVQSILSGKMYITASLAEILAGTFKQNKGLPHEKLSAREYEVFRHLVSGKRNKEIAKELSVSEKTISTYRCRLLEKMNMLSNAELVHYALNHHLWDTSGPDGIDQP